MHEALAQMLAKYECKGLEDALHALREILQEIVLLGLWRSKFFEKAAFYGGTALRVLYGLDRFSEDLDFSLIAPDTDFNWHTYTKALERELAAFGLEVSVQLRNKVISNPIQSAFLKTNTLNQLLVIETPMALARSIPKNQLLKIKLEVDTDPPPGFETETRYLLMPIPFAVRVFTSSDLFAGKMHAVLCRRWKSRVKGRDWYDLVWFAAHHPQLHLAHLEQRLRQTDHWTGTEALSEAAFRQQLSQAIESVDIKQARQEVEPFVKEPQPLTLWSRDFFHDIARRIQII
jgi:predicted nucleotidyltransferase component of viral defense system